MTARPGAELALPGPLRALRLLASLLASLLALLPALLLAGAGLVACASVPAPVLIALPPAAATRLPARAAAAGAVPAVLLVRRLIVPEYMAARRVRYWDGVATLAEWPDTYWAERVEIGMAREFVAGLRRRLPEWTVCDASCGDTLPDLTLKVELLRLDVMRREQRLSASAQVQLLAPGASSLRSPATTAWTRSYAVPLPHDSAQGQAQAMSELLGELADAAAAAVARAHAPADGAAAPP